VILIDWDTEGSEKGPNLVTIEEVTGHRLQVWVAECAAQPMPTIDSDVGQALTAAGINLLPSTSEETIRDPATLSQDELVHFAQRVQAIFYLDISDDCEFWNPDKEWEAADLLDELAGVLQEYGLVPTRISDAPL
jgi:hypothetical protein